MMIHAFAQPPFWAAKYIGIPFVDLGRTHEGCDCWGLVRLVLMEQARLDLPSLSTSYDSEKNHNKVIAEIELNKYSGSWKPVQDGEEKTFDVAEMSSPVRVRGKWAFPPLHVGIFVCPRWILHVERETASRLSCVEERGISNRILGIWRYAEHA